MDGWIIFMRLGGRWSRAASVEGESGRLWVKQGMGGGGGRRGACWLGRQ